MEGHGCGLLCNLSCSWLLPTFRMMCVCKCALFHPYLYLMLEIIFPPQSFPPTANPQNLKAAFEAAFETVFAIETARELDWQTQKKLYRFFLLFLLFFLKKMFLPSKKMYSFRKNKKSYSFGKKLYCFGFFSLDTRMNLNCSI